MIVPIYLLCVTCNESGGAVRAYRGQGEMGCSMEGIGFTGQGRKEVKGCGGVGSVVWGAYWGRWKG